jgi:hypothetical protein
MGSEHPEQPAISRLDLVRSTVHTATAGGAAGVEFLVAYEVSWPGPPAAPCRWRLDLELFEIDLVDPVHGQPDDLSRRTADDEVAYASITEKGHRVLGPDATASVLLALDEAAPLDATGRAPVVRAGTALLFATEEAIEIARAKGELPALDWDGDVFEALDFDNIIKVRALLRPISPGPVTRWTEGQH